MNILYHPFFAFPSAEHLSPAQLERAKYTIHSLLPEAEGLRCRLLLTDPEDRTRAEAAWFVDEPEALRHEILDRLHAGTPLTPAHFDQLHPLTTYTVLAAHLDALDQPILEDIHRLLDRATAASAALDIPALFALFNSRRAVLGIAPLPSLETLEAAIAEQRDDAIDAFLRVLTKNFSTKTLLDLLAQLDQENAFALCFIESCLPLLLPDLDRLWSSLCQQEDTLARDLLYGCPRAHVQAQLSRMLDLSSCYGDYCRALHEALPEDLHLLMRDVVHLCHLHGYKLDLLETMTTQLKAQEATTTASLDVAANNEEAYASSSAAAAPQDPTRSNTTDLHHAPVLFRCVWPKLRLSSHHLRYKSQLIALKDLNDIILHADKSHVSLVLPSRTLVVRLRPSIASTFATTLAHLCLPFLGMRLINRLREGEHLHCGNFIFSNAGVLDPYQHFHSLALYQGQLDPLPPEAPYALMLNILLEKRGDAHAFSQLSFGDEDDASSSEPHAPPKHRGTSSGLSS